MAFGQSSGPPASGRRIDELLELLQQAGHSDFRDARGPMGFTQRQAGGKFTVSEADEFIEQLQNEIYDGSGAVPTADAPDAPVAAKRQPRSPSSTKQQRALSTVPDDVLAAELQRRGWIVVEPS